MFTTRNDDSAGPPSYAKKQKVRGDDDAKLEPQQDIHKAKRPCTRVQQGLGAETPPKFVDECDTEGAYQDGQCFCLHRLMKSMLCLHFSCRACIGLALCFTSVEFTSIGFISAEFTSLALKSEDLSLLHPSPVHVSLSRLQLLSP